jgi:hypothetical protein
MQNNELKQAAETDPLLLKMNKVSLSEGKAQSSVVLWYGMVCIELINRIFDFVL